MSGKENCKFLLHNPVSRTGTLTEKASRKPFGKGENHGSPFPKSNL